MSKTFDILVLPGDHVGPEIVDEAVKVLHAIEQVSNSPSKSPLFPETPIKFNIEYEIFGGASIDKHGVPITREVLDKAQKVDAVLFGSVGGPKWGAALNGVRPEDGVLKLRQELKCWANIRPCQFISKRLEQNSVIKPDIVTGTDFIVLRENCGGAYFGPKVENDDFASDGWQYSKPEVQRIARMAGYLAKNYPTTNINFDKKSVKITSCDKANVLASSRLWRSVVQQTHDEEFPDVELVHQLADSAAMIMITKPTSLNGIVLCDNTFGDILSDESATLVGSLGLLPSASLSCIPGEQKGKAPGLYEPSHGSAPDLPRNVVNPIATILSAALMLRYSCNLPEVAKLVELSIKHVLDSKDVGGLELGTKDLKGHLSTSEMGDLIVKVFKEKAQSI